MNNSQVSNNLWTTFTLAAFCLAATMMAGGIYFLEASFSAKGFYAMAAIMLVYTSVAMTKTLRDLEEEKLLHNRIDNARAERLLMETKDSDLVKNQTTAKKSKAGRKRPAFLHLIQKP